MEMDYQERDSYKKIVKSATMLFSTKGYRGTTIKDITAGAGLAVGTFYLYFKSKQELYASIMEDIPGTIIMWSLFFIKETKKARSLYQNIFSISFDLILNK